MSGFCSIVIGGHIGRDAEFRETKDGPVLNFSVAVNLEKDGDPIWYNCAMWGKRGEKLAPYLTKGTAVQVSGPLKPRPYTGKKDGAEKMSLDIRVDQFSFAGSKGEQIPQPSPSEAERIKAMAKDIFTGPAEPDEVIPF